MLSVRKVKTKSGATAVQVVQYIGHGCKFFKHIGSSKDDLEINILKETAQKWISAKISQTRLFSEQRQKILVIEMGE
ncbi:MAG: hypothetical protein WCQ95_00425 [Bacteroidota bacterium]